MSDNGNLEMGSEQRLFRIGQVCRLTDIKSFTLRYWESEFPSLQPVKSPSGHRLYRREDVQTVLRIKRLLYDEGFTIAGARRYLRDLDTGTVREEALPRFDEELAERDAAPLGGAENPAHRAETEQHSPAHRSEEFPESRAVRLEDDSVSQYVGASASHRDGIASPRADSSRTDAATLLTRKLLLDLRDSLRAFLTLLENE